MLQKLLAYILTSRLSYLFILAERMYFLFVIYFCYHFLSFSLKPFSKMFFLLSFVVSCCNHFSFKSCVTFALFANAVCDEINKRRKLETITSKENAYNLYLTHVRIYTFRWPLVTFKCYSFLYSLGYKAIETLTIFIYRNTFSYNIYEPIIIQKISTKCYVLKTLKTLTSTSHA